MCLDTPRACLCAGALGFGMSFIHFDIEELTQLTYGMSDADSRKFMHKYIQENSVGVMNINNPIIKCFLIS